MTAKKKTVKALIIGAIIGCLVGVAAYNSMTTAEVNPVSTTDALLTCIVYIPCCMLYAFGYAFGWKRCKGFIAAAAKISADVAFFAIIVKLITGKGLGKGLFIAMFIFMFAVSIVWLPGVVWGIKALYVEHRDGTAGA